MKILHVAHQQIRKFGNTRVSWAQKLYHGLIKNDHYVYTFSDRDIAAFEAPLGIRDLGKNKANKRLVETMEAIQADLVIIGHCDIITNETIAKLRSIKPDVVISACNNDPLFVPENFDKILHRCKVVDNMFVSTGIVDLKPFAGDRAKLFHMPNPVDPAIENSDSSQHQNLPHDLIFCSKSEAHTQRGKTVSYLRENLSSAINFYTPGSYGTPGVWGRDYDLALAQSKMGLNLNRQEGYHWYSSARIAQMAGNGLLIFSHESANFESLLPPETLVYFNDMDELNNKVIDFHHDDEKRKHWASRCRDFFHSEMNNTLFAQYIVEASMNTPFSHPYIWHQHD